MSGAVPKLMTEEEFLSLPESTDPLELLDGEVILSPSPSYRHQLVLRRVVRALEDWAPLCVPSSAPAILSKRRCTRRPTRRRAQQELLP